MELKENIEPQNVEGRKKRNYRKLDYLEVYLMLTKIVPNMMFSSKFIFNRM
jgi:hypothetical protein